MTSSKKDFCIVTKMVLDLVNGLTEEQFNNILCGSAEMKYIEKGIDIEKRKKYRDILYNLALEEDIEKRKTYMKENEFLTPKGKLVEFCKDSKIDIKAKDTIDMIIDQVNNYIIKNKENILYRYNRSENLELGINDIANYLEKCMDVEEARKLILSSKVVDNKVNLLKLAKKLNVFLDREASYEVIMESIIKSVVEAKIRSYTIRKKI